MNIKSIVLTGILTSSTLLTTLQCKASSNASGDNEKTFIIGPETADCTGVAPMKCLQVKEKPTDSWTNFYTNIEGFTYEPGYEYVLKVKTEKLENVPADASSIKYTLIKQISKMKK